MTSPNGARRSWGATWARGSVVGVAVLGLSAPQGALATEDDFPVLGQRAVLGVRNQGTPAVVTLHGVRRTPSATIVYYSAGLPAGADTGSDTPGTAISRSLGASTAIYINSFVGGPCDIGLIDQAGAKVYTTLVGPRPVCTGTLDGTLGQAQVVAAATSPLPAGVGTVDVSVRGVIFPDVTVQDGLLEPAAKDQTASTFIAGQGWPVVPEDAIATATDVPRTIKPLYQVVSDLQDRVRVSKTQIDVSSDVLFAHNSATLSTASRAVIAQTAAELKAKKAAGGVTVTGHTDSDGSEAYNVTLSQRRAQAVAAALRPLLGSGITLSTTGKGETEAIASNESDAGKAKNRRVTLAFTPGSAS